MKHTQPPSPSGLPPDEARQHLWAALSNLRCNSRKPGYWLELEVEWWMFLRELSTAILQLRRSQASKSSAYPTGQVEAGQTFFGREGLWVVPRQASAAIVHPADFHPKPNRFHLP